MPTVKKATRKKEPPLPLKIYSMSLTAGNAEVLASLAQAAKDQIGRSISTSAVLRAILYLVRKKMLDEPAIIEAIEEELNTGRIWGTRPR